MSEEEIESIQHSCMWLECFGKDSPDLWLVVKDGILLQKKERLRDLDDIEAGSLLVRINKRMTRFNRDDIGDGQ